MNYGALELEIVSHLNTGIANTKVTAIPMPEDEAEFSKLFGKEQLIVALSEENPTSESKAMNMVYQETEATFAVLLQSKSLRGTLDKLGIYQLHALVKQHLSGFQLSIGQPMMYAGFKMQDKEVDIFQYAVYFKVKGVVLQSNDFDHTDTPPLLKEVIYQVPI